MSPKIAKLPEPQGLFVSKSLSSYNTKSQPALLFQPNPQQAPKKHFPVTPKSHSEIRDCAQSLSGEQLKRIQAGPVSINFGSIFIKSTIQQTFWVRNDLDKCISVQLDNAGVK